jgi:uroporphyrinogen-III synthase
VDTRHDTSASPALAGLRVLVTRPAHQAAALSDRLARHGAEPVELPVIEIVPASPEHIISTMPNLSTYDWLIFTSVNTVSTLEPLLTASTALPAIAVIGDATATALERLGIAVDLVPEEFVAESVLEAILQRGIAGKHVLLPRAEVARPTLPDGLRKAGAIVDVVPVYQTRLPALIDHETVRSVSAGDIHVVTFTSPSTVHNLLTLTGNVVPGTTVVACIGPVTADAARNAGLRVDIVAETYSIPGLVDALIQWRTHHD